jgi:hypothetical protein
MEMDELSTSNSKLQTVAIRSISNEDQVVFDENPTEDELTNMEMHTESFINDQIEYLGNDEEINLDSLISDQEMNEDMDQEMDTNSSVNVAPLTTDQEMDTGSQVTDEEINLEITDQELNEDTDLEMDTNSSVNVDHLTTDREIDIRTTVINEEINLEIIDQEMKINSSLDEDNTVSVDHQLDIESLIKEVDLELTDGKEKVVNPISSEEHNIAPPPKEEPHLDTKESLSSINDEEKDTKENEEPDSINIGWD